MPISADGTVDTSLIETQLESDIFEVTSKSIERYALAVNDHNPQYLNRAASKNVVAPPAFAIVPAMRVLRNAMANGTLPLSINRTVHGQHEMTFTSPIRSGDILVSSARVRDVNEHSSGTTVEIEIDVNREDGFACVNQILTAFVRRTTNIGSRPRPRVPEAEPLHVAVMKVTADQSLRYARASFTEGIEPHESHEAACALGYRTIFLQGQCTMAFAAKALVDNVAEGDPTLLRSIRVRFSQAVYPFDVLTTQIWYTGKHGGYKFNMVKDDGTLALTNGMAVVTN